MPTPRESPQRLTRVSVPALDDILGIAFPVLDDGFIRVIDYMGNDDAIIQAARVSYGEGTKRARDDRGLIRYLMRHRHTTPFEMCEIKIHVRVPMDCWRQWIRHRTASVNEYSTRYSVAIDSALATKPEEWRLQSELNKQGSSGYLDTETGTGLSHEERALHEQTRKVYEQRLAAGVAREQARKDLTLSTYTEAYWKVDLHNLLNFLALRMDTHAQAEIRAYATIIGETILSQWCPLAWEAFTDFRTGSISLSRTEITIVELVAAGQTDEAMIVARHSGLLGMPGTPFVRNREREEVELLLRRFNLSPPWINGDKIEG